MLRIGTSIILGMLLIIVESFIVMYWKGYATIQLGNIEQMTGVFAANFFLVFAILTDIKKWIDNRNTTNLEENY